MKIGIIGGGTVGRAVARTYLEFVDEVRVYDRVPQKATHDLYSTLDCDLVFVCLPTPQHQMGGGLDTEALDKFFSLEKVPAYHWRDRINFVLKSTVPVGTTKRLAKEYGLKNLVHSPEFLTARCAETDAKIPAVNVIGVTTDDYGVAEDGSSPDIWCHVSELYARRFPGVPILTMPSDESEAAKLCLNTAFAVKVALFNELKSFCDTLGCDWETVRRVILADGRTTAHHTLVPGPDGQRGFGGDCLPKDLAQFIDQFMTVSGHGGKFGWPKIAEAARDRNAFDRKDK